jgi:predicted DNA-binding protein YlxM (UPF0122 family)
MTYYAGDYSPSDIASDLEDAKRSIDDAISSLYDFEDADEEAAEQAQNFKNEVLEAAQSLSNLQQKMLGWVDDDSDLYQIRKAAEYIIELLDSSEKAPWTSKYSLQRRITSALYDLNEARKKEIWDHENPKTPEQPE